MRRRQGESAKSLRITSANIFSRFLSYENRHRNNHPLLMVSGITQST